jgi:glutathione S-transferase
MLTLFFAPGASSMAVHIALHEIGVAFEARPMSFWKKDMRSPDYLALNPEGKVPLLLVDGQPLTEVAAILFYLARRFPEAGLLPRNDVAAEAQAISRMSFCASTLHRVAGTDWIMRGMPTISPTGASAVDLFRLYWRLANSLKPAADDFPNLTAHYARMMARPAVQRTIEVESAIGYELPA